MWVFGYGSLMWDGWEAEFGCLRSTMADLPGYQRVFNKASVRNWGTRTVPGPTLNLMTADGACRGMAFEFPDQASGAIEIYLREREGRDFALRKKMIRLNEGGDVTAIVPLYEGTNLVRATTTEEIAVLVLRASGTNGSCASYVIGISDKLRAMDIDDPAVNALRRAVEKINNRS
jgi:glutathione-specific gamma-glutamylcyclotransferase